LGVQGNKRREHAGEDYVASVDPNNLEADFNDIRDVNLDTYDAVLACVPDKPKIELLRYCVDHGKHVLVEKPLWAEKDEQIIELEKLARANQVVCYTAYNHRFEPHIASLKTLLDEGGLGQIYRASFFYGNGTARDIRESPWRDQGMGVFSDLGSHLLDLSAFLFGQTVSSFTAWQADRFETKAWDHAIFGCDGSPALDMEVSFLCWRNTFTLDVTGELGSAHINGLCKWGSSTLTVRKRVFPSGVPEEQVETAAGPDPTWALEFEHFKQLCATGAADLEKDWWINSVLNGLTEGVAGQVVR
jgi:predicted dehydrogenase